MGKNADAHSLLHLAMENDGQLPSKMYIKLDTNLLWLKMPNVGLLIVKEPNRVLDKKNNLNKPQE